jgi:hypothetical protein
MGIANLICEIISDQIITKHDEMTPKFASTDYPQTPRRFHARDSTFVYQLQLPVMYIMEPLFESKCAFKIPHTN